MSEPPLVDYYAILNLPHDADLAGVENAYARISDELASLVDIDDSCREALQRVNEAYAVLSKPELRRQYDAIFLAAERAAEERAWKAYVRRRLLLQWAIVAALSFVIVAQAAALVYIGWDDFREPLGFATDLPFGGPAR